MTAPMPELTRTFYTDVEAAIKTQLLTVQDIPTDEAHWSLENRKFIPVEGEPYVRFTFRAQPNRLANIGREAQLIRHLGGCIIDYYVPRHEGTARSKQMTAAIVLALRPGRYLTYNGVKVLCRSCFDSNGMNDGQFYMRSVTLGWTADTISTT